MPIEAGQTLLHYRITDKLGEGGMGVVWRALDTTLDREVAIKVLPEAVAQDAERLTRFEREAKLLASLSHPNIAAVHGLHEANGERFLVMELVSGEDLAERLVRGALSVEETVRIALQVAQALEAAHDSGVIHRDLKPANVRLTPDGSVKVLDFGLAKAFDAAGSSQSNPSLSISPTMTSAGTVAGVILGTAAYMSPEQAAGQPIDKRCDVWSFGVVLYEMLVGRRMFDGETVSHTLADVLRAEIDWGRLPDDLPHLLRRLLRRCLDRDVRRRLRDIGEARVLLEDARSGALEAMDAVAAPTPATKQVRRRPLPWILAALATLVAAVSLGLLLGRGDAPSPQVARFTLRSPYGGSQRQGEGRLIAISPDGRTVVNCGAGGTDDLLYARPIDDFEAKPLVGTNSARLPFFSPDGRWLAFVTTEGFWKVNLGGGPPVKLGSSAAFPGAATWSPNGSIYFAASGELWQLSAQGGEPRLVPIAEETPGRLRDPWALPSGRSLLLASGESSRQPGRLMVLDLDDGSLEEIGLQGSDPRYLPTGHLLYTSGERVLVVGFDASRLRPVGTPLPVLERVLVETGTMQLDISRTGTAVYRPFQAEQGQPLVLVDRQGAAQPIVSTPLPFPDSNDPRFSPDGSKLAISVGSGPIWVVDLETQTPTMVSESGFYPLWSADGGTLVFGSTRNRSFDLYRLRADLSQPEELLLDRENNLRSADWAPDGTLLFREEIPGKGMDLMAWPDLDDESSIAVLLDGPEDELSPAISPDGRWLAYVSTQSGRDEVFVTGFPHPGGRVQVSVSGGTSPAWSPGGAELFYFERDRFVSVKVATDPGFRVLRRDTLFTGNYTQYRWQRQYDVHPDGEHFVMIENPPGGDMEVVLNWFAELERLTAYRDRR